MKTTISVIKADVGSIGGHIKPSARLKETVERFVREKGKKLLLDVYVSSTGDDVALLMSHDRGVDDPKIHELAWDAFMAGTKVAKEQGLYGAGQDLLKDAFSGNVRGLGPASCEMEFEERPNEPFVFFAADKTDPGRIQPADVPRVLRSDALRGAAAVAQDGEGLHLHHHGRQPHRGRPGDRVERARRVV